MLLKIANGILWFAIIGCAAAWFAFLFAGCAVMPDPECEGRKVLVTTCGVCKGGWSLLGGECYDPAGYELKIATTQRAATQPATSHQGEKP